MSIQKTSPGQDLETELHQEVAKSNQKHENVISALRPSSIIKIVLTQIKAITLGTDWPIRRGSLSNVLAYSQVISLLYRIFETLDNSNIDLMVVQARHLQCVSMVCRWRYSCLLAFNMFAPSPKAVDFIKFSWFTLFLPRP